MAIMPVVDTFLRITETILLWNYAELNNYAVFRRSGAFLLTNIPTGQVGNAQPGGGGRSTTFELKRRTENFFENKKAILIVMISEFGEASKNKKIIMIILHAGVCVREC